MICSRVVAGNITVICKEFLGILDYIQYLTIKQIPEGSGFSVVNPVPLVPAFCINPETCPGKEPGPVWPCFAASEHQQITFHLMARTSSLSATWSTVPNRVAGGAQCDSLPLVLAGESETGGVCLLDKTPVAHFALELALDCIDKRTG